MPAHVQHSISAAVHGCAPAHRLPRFRPFASALSLTLCLSARHGSGTAGATAAKPETGPAPVVATCQASQS